MPTPSGVPVHITLPASSVVPVERNDAISRTPKMRSEVEASCPTSPFTVVVRFRPLASPSSSGETTRGRADRRVRVERLGERELVAVARAADRVVVLLDLVAAR